MPPSYPTVKHWIAATTAPLHLHRKRVPELPALQSPQPGDTILFFSPHPDDETFFAGGFLANAVAAGAAVHIALVSDGNNRGKHEERVAEFQKATRLLGIPPHNLHFYLLPDGKLTSHRATVGRRMFETISELKPTLTIAPHPSDAHADHRAVAEEAAAHTSGTLLRYLSHFPPSYPWPRKHKPAAYLFPPRSMLHESWCSFKLSYNLQETRRKAMHAYERELKTPTLRSMLLSFDRKNEIYSLRD